MNMSLELAAKIAMAVFAKKEKTILSHLERHFGCNPHKYPIVKAEFPNCRHPCVAQGIQSYFERTQKRYTVIGVVGSESNPELSDIVHADMSREFLEGPIQHGEVSVIDQASLSYISRAVYLVRDSKERFAVLTTQFSDHKMKVEVISKRHETADKFLQELRALADENSVFKGKVLGIKMDYYHDLEIEFHKTPKIERQQVILPESTLNLIEMHTSKFSLHREQLRSYGQHLKRGLLLYGPPGTGKSLTINYLISSMPERTSIVLSGSAVKFLEEACALARSLQPSTIIIDDVDLVAEERTYRYTNPMLFELLNQMDSISDDCDVLFLLSTNRPESLEPALASRPGRIDQAVEIPLPDHDARKRLFEYYGRGLNLESIDLEKFVMLTDGASGAFIRELFRKAVLRSAIDDESNEVTEYHLEEALRSLRQGGAILEKLLASGASSSASLLGDDHQ